MDSSLVLNPLALSDPEVFRERLDTVMTEVANLSVLCVFRCEAVRDEVYAAQRALGVAKDALQKEIDITKKVGD